MPTPTSTPTDPADFGLRTLFSQVAAGVMLSFGGLLSEVVGGGSGGINTSNPGLVKFFSGAVFPVGLIMYVEINIPRLRYPEHLCTATILNRCLLSLSLHRTICPGMIMHIA